MGGRVGADRATTRTEQVYGQLRADILAGALQPGARLPFAELSARYRSSTSAIREGLQRLVEQGLVTSEPQLGFRVVTLSIADLEDLTTARREIEGLALRYSIEHGDLAWEAGVVAAWHTLERTPLGSTAPDGREALAARLVVGTCGLPRVAHRCLPEPSHPRHSVVATGRRRAVPTLVVAGCGCGSRRRCRTPVARRRRATTSRGACRRVAARTSHHHDASARGGQPACRRTRQRAVGGRGAGPVTRRRELRDSTNFTSPEGDQS